LDRREGASDPEFGFAAGHLRMNFVVAAAAGRWFRSR
jgi:hypothetical protein